jgi:hypothetical protein
LFARNRRLILACLLTRTASKILNQSKVGLILSELEGCPRCVVEYLLCGLPVVSTKFLSCGRKRFLNHKNSIIVDDTEEDVAIGVAKAIKMLDSGEFQTNKIVEDCKQTIASLQHSLSSLLEKNYNIL